MFHKYVLRSRGGPVDIGRAQFLMDQALARDTAAWVDSNWADIVQQGGGGSRDQAFWDHYCERHAEKYGKYFEPDVNPDWN